MVGYVYILHFDRPLHHSQHYIGCTSDPRTRFTMHAQGRGANIVRAALAAGIGFTVGAVGTTHGKGMRRIERQLKNWHGAADQCECCSIYARKIPGTTPYPLDGLPFPRDSEALARLGGVAEYAVRMCTPGDGDGLAREVKRVMRPEKEALGFIPAGGVGGLTGSIERERMALAFMGTELVGYCAFTETPELVRVHQCVVSDVHRGNGLGRRLVAQVQAARPGVPVQAKVRDDLAANEFWQAIGFIPTGFETHDTSGCRLNVYRWHPACAACQAG